LTEYRFKFIYSGGDAENNRLDLYDGAVSLQGIARSLAITTHAFISGEVRTHGESAPGASFFLNPPRRGSFILEATVWITETVAAGLFYDFVSYTFKEAVGLENGADDQRRSLRERIEPTIVELSEVLENPLSSVHRPIQQNTDMTLMVARPRGQELVTFDAETGKALLPTVEQLSDPVVGNVTRYNTISRWGRFFDRSEGRVISFFLEARVTEHERSLITWSLHEANLNREGTLYLNATAIVTPSRVIKRYNVTGVLDRPSP